MNTSDFNYHLPPSSIAQTPLEPRDSSRLLVLHRDSGELEHRVFHDAGRFLRPNDLLILNRTRVIPARIFARKPTGGKIELLLLRRRDLLRWEALVGGKGLRVGSKLRVEDGPEATILEFLDGAERLLFACDLSMTASVARIRAASLSDPQRSAILGGNMTRILARRPRA